MKDNIPSLFNRSTGTTSSSILLLGMDQRSGEDERVGMFEEAFAFKHESVPWGTGLIEFPQFTRLCTQNYYVPEDEGDTLKERRKGSLFLYPQFRSENKERMRKELINIRTSPLYSMNSSYFNSFN